MVARDGSWHGYVGGDKMWAEPARNSVIRQPRSKVRLYIRPAVGFREDGHSTLEPVGTRFEVLGINDVPYQPELHVRVDDGPDVGREGWVYAQTLLLGPVADMNRPSRG